MNAHFILYTFVIFVILYLIIAATIRFKMQFWYTQPVFHIYNLKYWLKPPGFINKEPPRVNKFVNLVNNKLITINTDRDTTTVDNSVTIKQICHFIRDYYVIHPKATYKPTMEDIMAYLECSNHPSFFNIYQEPRMLFESSNGEDPCSIIPDQEIVAVASARVLNICLYPGKGTREKKEKRKISFAAYYVDNLCVKPGYRKKGIPPQMIQTFYYNVARINKKVNAYMFKREGKLTAIVPLVYFDTHAFDIRLFSTDILLNPSMSLIEIGKQQLNVFVSFIKEQMLYFDCVVLPDVSSILNLINLEKLLIYGVLSNGELIAAYIFRPLALSVDNHAYGTVECITILSKNKKDQDILIAGFNMSLLKIKSKTAATTLLLEETAHSQPIIAALNTNYTVLRNYQTPTAFYLYNYACYSLKKNKTLLIY